MSQLHSQESEQGLLGSILKNPSVLHDISLCPDDFYRESHKVIFSAISTMAAEKAPIDMISVVSWLMSNKKLDVAGGSIYLMQLEELTSGSLEYAEHYAQVIKDYAVKRALLSACQEGVEIIKGANGEKCDIILDRVQSNIMSINSPTKGGFCSISEVAREVNAEILHSLENSGEMTGITTGLSGLDSALGGWQPTDLIVMAARPGMGKTAVMLNFLDNAARIRYPVGCFSVEMASKQLVYRLVSRRTGISYQRMKLGLLDPSQAELVKQALAEINGLPITIDDRSSITELEIVREARRMKREQNIQMLAIDYLQRIRSSRPARSEAEEYGKIIQSFKNLARELEIPVMVLSQLNRKVEEREDKRPMLSDLKASGDIEQEADIILLLYRDEYYNEKTAQKNLIEIDIAKFRNGTTRRYIFGWDGKSQSMFSAKRGDVE